MRSCRPWAAGDEALRHKSFPGIRTDEEKAGFPGIRTDEEKAGFPRIRTDEEEEEETNSGQAN